MGMGVAFFIIFAPILASRVFYDAHCVRAWVVDLSPSRWDAGRFFGLDGCLFARGRALPLVLL